MREDEDDLPRYDAIIYSFVEDLELFVPQAQLCFS